MSEITNKLNAVERDIDEVMAELYGRSQNEEEPSERDEVLIKKLIKLNFDKFFYKLEKEQL